METSNFLDYLFIPSKNNKIDLQEVSTPYKLRQEMLNTIPNDFWTSPKKILEPTAGKGGFLLDVISRFMNGLKDRIPDKEQRYKFIVEDCIYFAELNERNIEIIKQLIDVNDEYKLNYYVGDSLKMDIEKEFGLKGFDLVVGNPPYNKGKNSNFYVSFMKYSYDILKLGGLNLFVIPNRFLVSKHKSNQILSKFQVHYIKHTTSYFTVSTKIGYYLSSKVTTPDNSNVLCVFDKGNTLNIDLKYPTPTENNSIEYKLLSDKIITHSYKQKLDFIKDKKEHMNVNEYIFIPRHWTRYSSIVAP